MVQQGKIGRILFSRLSEMEDLAEAVRLRAEKANVKAGGFILIGTLNNVVLGFYEKGEYKLIPLDGPLEIASCAGNIALDEKGATVVHAHIIVSDDKGQAFGGHLMKESHVGATAELMLIEAVDINLQRAFDQKTKLKLLRSD